MMPKWFFDGFTNYRARRIAGYLAKHVNSGETILDCGCGSMLIAEMLRQRSRVHAFGTDVIHLNQKNHYFCMCSGEKLAFPNNSFDTVCLIFALHHMSDPIAAVRDCLRVAKKRLIITEDVYRNRFEFGLLKFLDYHGNRVISKDMSLPFNFRMETEWRIILEGLNAGSVTVETIRPNPWRPSRHRMFILEKRSGS
jgi:SAM-dependent methyltransferase